MRYFRLVPVVECEKIQGFRTMDLHVHRDLAVQGFIPEGIGCIFRVDGKDHREPAG